MASVDLENVDKVYPGGVTAVADCNLEIRDGELMVLVGPSGCGKSTLLRLVAGLEEVTTGTIRIGGQVANDRTPQQRNIAMVFQDYALYPYLTVRGNMEFPLRMRRLSRIERTVRVQRTAELLNLARLLDRLPKELSGGERQRVAMGRALVREPSVFLLDEPLSNLDAKLRVQVRAEIGALQQRTGTTMIYVTHDQVEAMTLGDRVALLDRGHLQQVDTPKELYERPANVFVAGFIGTPPMNLFPARVELEPGQCVLAVANQQVRVTMPSAALDRLKPHAGAILTAGVRPESLPPSSTESTSAMSGTVEQIEFLGHETLLHVHVGSNEASFPVVSRVDGVQDVAIGERIALQIDASGLHLFGKDGNAIDLR
jgi:multiple sugar transport system ATP-binding protein